MPASPEGHISITGVSKFFGRHKALYQDLCFVIDYFSFDTICNRLLFKGGAHNGVNNGK
jgi:hypothetical protein